VQIFVFQIPAEPESDHPLAADVRGAVVTVWVLDKSIKSASARACHFITGYGWRVADAPYAYFPTAAQLAALKGPEAEDHLACRRHGISAHFDPWPEGAVEGTLNFRPCGTP
jgi:hypothetical protein